MSPYVKKITETLSALYSAQFNSSAFLPLLFMFKIKII